MVVLGVLLLVLVVLLVLFVLLTGADQQVRLTAESLNVDWEPPVLVVFLLGAVSLLLLGVAVAMIRSGTRRSAQRRRELRRLREAERERGSGHGRDHDTSPSGSSAAEGRSDDSTSSQDRPSMPHRLVDVREHRSDAAAHRPVSPQDPGPGSAGETGTAGDSQHGGSQHGGSPAGTSASGGWFDDPSDPGRRGRS